MRDLVRYFVDPRHACGVLAGASTLLLGGAFFAQYVGSLYPCSLCVLQRFPHIPVIIFGWLGYKQTIGHTHRKRLLWLMGICLLGTAGMGFWHAGIEYGLYSGPASCSGSVTGTTLEGVREQLMKAEITRCDIIPWALFGISLAGYNGLISFASGIFAFWAATNGNEKK
ncbi:MAG: disulfide bond formation protein B [Rhodospirillaceae bacterium]